MPDDAPPAGPPASDFDQLSRVAGAGATVRAYLVHLLTASGIICAFFAVAEICRPIPDPRIVFAWLAVQVLIDAIDGPLARLCRVKERAPRIDGRTIDDIVDYLTYTFIPLLLVWRMGWVPQPAAAFVAPAMVASLFGFANTGAKDEGGGYFLGFPSYWNIVALYLGPLHHFAGPWPGGILVIVLAVLTVLPVRFVYPNLAPRPWRVPTLAGSVVWAAILVAVVLADYPRPPIWLLLLSLVYPAYYIVLSVWLDVRARRRK